MCKEVRTYAAVREVVAVEVVLSRAAPAEEVFRFRVRCRRIVVADYGFCHAFRIATQAGGVGERFDSAGDVAEGIGWRSLVAQRAGGRGGGFDFPLIHAVVVTIKIPGRAADDACGPVVRMGRRAGDRRPSKHVARGARGTTLDVGVNTGLVKEFRGQWDFVGEAEALRGFGTVACLDQADRAVDPGEAAQVARCPFRRARRGLEDFRRAADLIHQVGAVVVQVGGHAVHCGGVGRAVEEGRTAISRVRGDGRFFLAGVDFQRAEDGVG